jgi:hypothetical protein
MKLFLADIDSNQPNAQGAYDIFKAETAAVVDTIMKVRYFPSDYLIWVGVTDRVTNFQHVQVCNAWCSTFYRLLDEEFSEAIPHTLKRYVDNLISRFSQCSRWCIGSKNAL